ncbi:MAG: amidohydrolase family protein [Proteobacteria bacterium]|nr:amidohydrolase family protein [Pseudomonadota bacterium]
MAPRTAIWLTALALTALALAAPPGKAAEGELLPRADFAIERTRSDPARPVRAPRTAYRGPIIDAHLHLDPPRRREANDLGAILAALAEAGVETAVFMPTPNEGRFRESAQGQDEKRELLARGQGRVRLFCGSDYISVWLNDAFALGYREREVDSILARLSADLAAPSCAGVGEIGLFHFNKKGDQAVVTYAPGFKPFLAIVGLAAGKGAWLDLHAEPVEPEGASHEDEVFGGLALLFRRFPNLKLILSHTAMTNPTNARRILAAYPTVMMNLKIVREHDGWRNLEPVTDEQGALYEDWAKLFEEMPGRFMIGTDAKFGRRSFSPDRYRREIERIRLLLGSLSPEAQRPIAVENARRVLGGG